MAAGMDQESIVRRELTSRCIAIVRVCVIDAVVELGLHSRAQEQRAL